MNFTGVNYYDGQGFLVRKKLGVASAKELNGASVCTQQGTTSEFYLRDNLGFTNESLILVPTAPQCMDALTRGDAMRAM